MPAGPVVAPRYATPRDHSRRTLGGAVARVAELLGTPLMPHQRLIADVAGEVDHRGLTIHPFVIVTIQRQAGKTQLDLAQSVQRCLWKPRARVWHTAQTGQDAREKWDELQEAVMASKLAEFVKGKPRRGKGDELLEFVNGSKLRPHPPTIDSLHGKQSDVNNVDEGWSFDELQGSDLLQAIGPTQLTRPGAQTFVWSTMGNASSSWFHGLVDAAKTGVPVVEGVPAPILFDWGIPDDVDPDDIDAVARYHPAVGWTTSVESLRAARAAPKMTSAEYARAYGNRRTGGRESLILPARWEAARTFEDLPAGRPTYGLAVYEPRDGGNVTGALVACVPDAAGRPVVEVVETRPGRNWLTQRVLDLQDRGLVAVARKGPAGPVADALEKAGVELHEVNGLDEATASQDLWDRLCDDEAQEDGPRLLHRDHPALDAAVDVAGRRFIGEGAWVFSAKESTGDVACLQAAVVAVRAVVNAPAPIMVGPGMVATY